VKTGQERKQRKLSGRVSEGKKSKLEKMLDRRHLAPSSAAAALQRRRSLRLRFLLALLAAATLLAALKLSIGRDRGVRGGDADGARTVRRRDLHRKRRSGGGAVQLSLHASRRRRRPECPEDLASALMAGYKRVGGSREEELARSKISSSSSLMPGVNDLNDLSSVYSWDPPALACAEEGESSYSSQPSSSSSSTTAAAAASSSSPSWFDSQDWGSLYPRCTQADEWCDARYPRGETDAVQRALHAHQNPADCGRARLLVLSAEYSSGLGSSLHIHAYMLSLALSDNRVLVVDPAARWEYAPRGLCSCGGDVEELPRTCEPGTVLSNKDCFFLPASRCPLPSSGDWRTTAPQFAPGSDARVMQARSFYDFFGVSQCDIMVLAREMTTRTKREGGNDTGAAPVSGRGAVAAANASSAPTAITTASAAAADPSSSSVSSSSSSPPKPGETARERIHRRDRAAAAAALAAFADRPPSWWLAQLMKYMLRPRPRVLRDFVAPMQARAFGGLTQNDGKKDGNATTSSPSSPLLPHPLASVFIRGGDKGKESALLPAQAYLDELEPLAEKLGIRDLYVSSDDGDAIKAVRRAYGGFAESPGSSGGNDPLGAAAADDDDDANGDGKKQETRNRKEARRQYRVHSIDWPRPRGGVTYAQVLAWRDRPEMEDMVRLALADVFVTAQADVQAGTLSSNWCRVGDMLRRANGRGRLPYVTPERPAQLWVASCESVEPEGKDYAARAAEFPRARAKLWEATAPSWVE